MERQLRQCPCCKEWFNTTSAIMIDHYKIKHEFVTNKAFEVARLAALVPLLAERAKSEPFPKSMMTAIEAHMVQFQIMQVASATQHSVNTPPRTHEA